MNHDAVATKQRRRRGAECCTEEGRRLLHLGKGIAPYVVYLKALSEMIDRSDLTSDRVHFTVLQSDISANQTGLRSVLSSDRESDRPIGIRPAIVSRTFYCPRRSTSDRNDQPFCETL
jgi:hypothetical protein